MAKLYEFPTKKELPEIAKESLRDIAEAYIETLKYVLMTEASDNPTRQELDELRDLVTIELEEALTEAIENCTYE